KGKESHVSLHNKIFLYHRYTTLSPQSSSYRGQYAMLEIGIVEDQASLMLLEASFCGLKYNLL
ncbi:MAG: hypothetical protein CMD74_01630, partial [Gammaproteobacteria bacterium]|nr:hypothetical protein [Gammaproteobacteria bacterium]